MELVESGINEVTRHRIIIGYKANRMVQYRRNRVMGGSYFFTVTLRDRKSTVLIDHLEFLREAVRKTREARPFTIEAWVVLPEHMHALWTLPPDDADYSSRWRSIKSHFTHQLAKQIPINRNTKGEYALWQRRFWEHTLRDDVDFSRHIDYIHYNPVKHGHVKQVKDWPYSSFHRFVAKTVYPLNWGCANNDTFDQYQFGE